MALAAGGVFGLVLYLVNFYGFTAVFPWFAMARGGLSIFVHITFGVVAALAYKGLQRRKIVSVTRKESPPPARPAHVQAQDGPLPTRVNIRASQSINVRPFDDTLEFSSYRRTFQLDARVRTRSTSNCFLRHGGRGPK